MAALTIATVTGSLKAAADTVKTMINLRDTAMFQAKAIELQGQISSALADAISAYEAQTTQLQRIRELEKEVAAFETWETEKKRYKLSKLPPGIFVYALQAEMAAGEPLHYICEKCYQNNKKSILHGWGVDEYGIEIFKCHGRGESYSVGLYQAKPHIDRDHEYF